MINFIKNLLGFGAKETVKEILTPPVKSDPVVTAVTASTYIDPAKPLNKVKAITVPATAANTKPKAKPAVTQGNTKGGNGAVKQQPKQSNKPKAPGKPKARRK
jgi:hypothetical protein